MKTFETAVRLFLACFESHCHVDEASKKADPPRIYYEPWS